MRRNFQPAVTHASADAPKHTRLGGDIGSLSITGRRDHRGGYQQGGRGGDRLYSEAGVRRRRDREPDRFPSPPRKRVAHNAPSIAHQLLPQSQRLPVGEALSRLTSFLDRSSVSLSLTFREVYPILRQGMGGEVLASLSHRRLKGAHSAWRTRTAASRRREELRHTLRARHHLREMLQGEHAAGRLPLSELRAGVERVRGMYGDRGEWKALGSNHVDIIDDLVWTIEETNAKHKTLVSLSVRTFLQSFPGAATSATVQQVRAGLPQEALAALAFIPPHEQDQLLAGTVQRCGPAIDRLRALEAREEQGRRMKEAAVSANASLRDMLAQRELTAFAHWKTIVKTLEARIPDFELVRGPAEREFDRIRADIRANVKLMRKDLLECPPLLDGCTTFEEFDGSLPEVVRGYPLSARHSLYLAVQRQTK